MGSSDSDEGSRGSGTGTGAIHNDRAPVSLSLPSTGVVSGGAPAVAAAAKRFGAKLPDVKRNSDNNGENTSKPPLPRLVLEAPLRGKRSEIRVTAFAAGRTRRRRRVEEVLQPGHGRRVQWGAVDPAERQSRQPSPRGAARSHLAAKMMAIPNGNVLLLLSPLPPGCFAMHPSAVAATAGVLRGPSLTGVLCPRMPPASSH